METRVTGVHLRSARRSVLLECVQHQGILELNFTAELPYDSYHNLLRCTCCKNIAELINKTTLDFEIAGTNTLIIRDRLDGCFTPSCILPSCCKAWIIKELPRRMDGAWLTICPIGSNETFEYSISHDEYFRFKYIAGIAPEALLTKEIITVRRNGIVGVGNVSHLFVTITEERKVHFQNCVLVRKFEVSAYLSE